MAIATVIQTDSGFKIVDWQLHDLLQNETSIRLAVIENKSKDDFFDYVVSRRLGNILKGGEIEIGDKYYFLYYDKGIEFHDPPIRGAHGIKDSPDSSAEYFIYDDKTGILFQYLPRGSTSRNYHTRGDEIFYNLGGDCRLCKCFYPTKNYQGDVLLEKETPFIVRPYECHQLHASSTPVVNIILMPPGVGRSDHHYPEACIKQLYFLLPQNV